jgi:Fe2+ transport system protein FeoA
MEKEGVQEGVLVQVNKTGEKPLPVHLVDSGEDVELGEGEAKKLIVEVTAGDIDS